MIPQFERNRIYCMDALEMLEQLPDASADLILTDPPYGISYQNHFTKSRHPEIIGDQGFDYESMAANCYRILKDNTHAYFFTRFDRYPYHVQMLIQAGFTVKNFWSFKKAMSAVSEISTVVSPITPSGSSSARKGEEFFLPHSF